MIESTSFREELHGVAHRWWVVLVLGILLVIGGFLAFGYTVTATVAAIAFLGIILLVTGVIDTIEAFTARTWRGFGLHLSTGLLLAIVGVLFLARPRVSISIVTIVLALMFFASGLARLAFALTERYAGRGWDGLTGVASIILGALVAAQWPLSAFWFVGLLVGVELLLRGLNWIWLAVFMRRIEMASPHRPLEA